MQECRPALLEAANVPHRAHRRPRWPGGSGHGRACATSTCAWSGCVRLAPRPSRGQHVDELTGLGRTSCSKPCSWARTSVRKPWSCSSTTTTLTARSPRADHSGRGPNHVQFVVDELDPIVEALRAEGLDAWGGPVDWPRLWRRVLYAKDPGGERGGVQRTAARRAAPGGRLGGFRAATAGCPKQHPIPCPVARAACSVGTSPDRS